jgi:ferredoxin
MRTLVYLPGVVTLEFFGEKCTGCGLCLEVCPHQVLAMDNGLVRIVDADACMECGACATNCPFGAISVQSGVGCAAAVIKSSLGRGKSEGPVCC